MLRSIALALAHASLIFAAKPLQYTVDDYDAENVHSEGWGEGWFQLCAADAYLGNYHHDWAGDRGQISVEISAPLEKAGCYAVEEYHPGSNHACATYLPTDAPLEVYHDEGSMSQLEIDLSKNAGQWNHLGFFRLGTEGPQLRFHNNGGRLSCGASSCWWVADAYRFTLATDAECAGTATAATELSAQDARADAHDSAVDTECTEFSEELLGLLDLCGRASSCDAEQFAPRHECRRSAEAFADRHQSVLARCLQRCVKDRERFRACKVQMEAVLSCPETNAALEEAAMQEELRKEREAMRADHLRGAAQNASYDDVLSDHGEVPTEAEEKEAEEEAPTPITQANQAVAFNGDCSSFKMFADQVADKCSEATCCREVVDNDECRMYAAGLHALFPTDAMNFCAKMVRLERRCTCFVRQVAACAVQAEVHEILYEEKWEPSCTNFPTMDYQQDPANIHRNKHSLLMMMGYFIFFSTALISIYAACKERSSTVGVYNGEDAPTANVLVVGPDDLDISRGEGIQEAVRINKQTGRPLPLIIEGEIVPVDEDRVTAVARGTIAGLA